MLISINKLAYFVCKKPNLFRILAISLFISFIHYSDTIAQPRFTEITSQAGIDHHYLSMDQLGGGAAFFDMDNDGDEDLWISGGVNRDVLYENDGKGSFSEIGEEAGLAITDLIITTGVITGDLDNDGFKDVFLSHSKRIT